MSDLAAFLLARLAEDENEARWAATSDYTAEWQLLSPNTVQFSEPLAAQMAERAAGHVARWHPARVLAECEARRKIVELHPGITDGYSKNTVLACETCCQWDDYPSRVMGENPPCPDERYPCLTLRFLATPYSSHPDFDPAWLVGGQGD